MAGLAKKKEVTQDLQAQINEATVAVVADYRGLTVEEMTALRAELYKVNAAFTVAKNTLARRAIKGGDWEALEPLLKGPTALLLGRADQVEPVKILTTFLTKNKKPNEIRGGFLDGKMLTAKEVDVLAKLPPINELRAKLMGGIAGPQNQLVAAISGPQRALVNVLDQLSKKKQEAGA